MVFYVASDSGLEMLLSVIGAVDIMDDFAAGSDITRNARLAESSNFCPP